MQGPQQRRSLALRGADHPEWEQDDRAEVGPCKHPFRWFPAQMLCERRCVQGTIELAFKDLQPGEPRCQMQRCQPAGSPWISATQFKNPLEPVM
jgi:hypothetical protein